MKGAIGGFAAGVLGLMAVLAVAEDKKGADPNAKPDDAVWLEGEITDLPSYLKDGTRGKDHWKEAKALVKSGAVACMITFDGKLYVVTGYGRDGLEAFNYVGEQVRIKATVFEKDGVKCLVAKDAKKLPPDYKPGEGSDHGRMGGGGDAGGKK